MPETHSERQEPKVTGKSPCPRWRGRRPAERPAGCQVREGLQPNLDQEQEAGRWRAEGAPLAESWRCSLLLLT